MGKLQVGGQAHSHRLAAAGQTDTGLVRSQNEDAFFVDLDGELFLVADGMGGHRGGWQASRLAVQHVSEQYRRLFDHGTDLPTDPVDRAREALRRAVRRANEEICKAAQADESLQGMGTTLVVAAGVDDAFVIAHLGDSRAYLFRAGSVAPLTTDHSLLTHYLETGRITPAQAVDFPQKNIILKALGLNEMVEPDFQVVSKVPGDILVLCSDGLSDQVDDATIDVVLRHASDPAPHNLARRLVNVALRAGGEDNVTAVVLRVGELTSEEATRDDGFDADLCDEPTREYDQMPVTDDEVTAEVRLSAVMGTESGAAEGAE